MSGKNIEGSLRAGYATIEFLQIAVIQPVECALEYYFRNAPESIYGE